MNSTLKTAMFFSLAALFSCQQAKKGAETKTFEPVLTAEEAEAGKFTAEVMLKMKRLGETTLSPDGKTVVYGVTVVDAERNKSYTNLYAQTVGDTVATRLTCGNHKDLNARFSPDGKSLYFLSDRSGSLQLWKMDADGGHPSPMPGFGTEVAGFELSPAGDKVWYTAQVKVDSTAKDLHPGLPEAKAMIYDDLMARHWNYWLDGTYSHLFVADFRNGKAENAKDITAGGAWDVPLAPYFDLSEIAWNHSGTQIAYTAKKLHGKAYAESTDSDIYLYDLATGETRNLTEGMPGYDRYPLFSPDDRKIAWTSMERAGNESDKERLFVADLATGAKSYLTGGFDYNAQSLQWADDETLYFIAPIEATHQICRVRTLADEAGADRGPNVEVLTEGLHDYTSIRYADGKLLAAKTTLTMAPELFVVEPGCPGDTQMTFMNRPIYEKIRMGEVQKRWVPTTDGKRMLTWVLLPPDFDPTKKYPTLLYCQGGPQSVVSQRWSYRWNLALMASQGYVVVAPNRRGLPSFGQEWLDQISGDYSGQNIRDYLSAIDDVAKEPWVDTARLGCVGASYGGYSVYYLAGHHEKRFKAFIAHCGMFNFESFYLSTEELWFPNNDIGGPYWKEDPVTRRSYAHSPHKFADRWDTPILIIVGLQDFRIPYTESLQAFTAARLKGLDARLVAFEDEGHQVFKPQNSLLWHREFFGWLDKYLKK